MTIWMGIVVKSCEVILLHKSIWQLMLVMSQANRVCIGMGMGIGMVASFSEGEVTLETAEYWFLLLALQSLVED